MHNREAKKIHENRNNLISLCREDPLLELLDKSSMLILFDMNGLCDHFQNAIHDIPVFLLLFVF